VRKSKTGSRGAALRQNRVRERGAATVQRAWQGKSRKRAEIVLRKKLKKMSGLISLMGQARAGRCLTFEQIALVAAHIIDAAQGMPRGFGVDRGTHRAAAGPHAWRGPMTPLLITLTIALGIGAFGCFAYYARLAKYDPSIRSMVANEERQGRFLLSGAGLILVALLAWWLV
jgi:hypothetical protein